MCAIGSHFIFHFIFCCFLLEKSIIQFPFSFKAFITTLGFTNFVKNMVGRLRLNNEADLLDLIRILQTPSNYSFFSGHASSSFVLATFCGAFAEKEI
jgi:undecaprenyl-diphosphatase